MSSAGRQAPPAFMFEPLQTRALHRLADPSTAPGKLVLAVAPAGYGKTVLMGQWCEQIRQRGQSALWLSLDDRVTSIDPLLRAIENQLDRPAERPHPTQALFSGEEPLETRIDALIERLHDLASPLTVFIDNLQACPDPALPRLLDRLVLETPPHLRLVLSSTQEPAFDLPRAQLRGLVTMLGPTDLGFSTAEVGALLGIELSQRIGHRGVEDVHRRTEGWPAAVRMASLILGAAADPLSALHHLSGTEAQFSRLLQRQVLASFPAPVRRFLLQVAPLRSFCSALCDDVLDNANAEPPPLAYLLERQAFLVPLDRQGGWYRLHGLLRDYLQDEARRELGEARVRDILDRTARWCLHHERWPEAMGYALDARAPETAAAILERIAPNCVRDGGRVQQYQQWVEDLHWLGAYASPEGEYWYAWSLAFQRRHDEARRCCDRLVARIGPVTDDAAAVALSRRLAILRTSIACLSDRMDEASQGAAVWLGEAHTHHDDPFDLTAAHCIEAGSHMLALRFVEARRAIQAAHETAARARSEQASGWVATYAAIIASHMGDHAQADQMLSAVLAQAGSGQKQLTGLVDMVAMVSAKCAVEMGLADDGKRLLELGLEGAIAHGFLESTACGLEAAVKLWSGASDDPFQPARLRDVAAAYPPRLGDMLSCHIIRRLLMLHRTEEACEEARRIGLGLEDAGSMPVSHPLMQALHQTTRIDLLIATGRHRLAEPLIDAAWRNARDAQLLPDQIDLTLVQASLALRAGHPTEAMRLLGRAIHQAAPKRIIRPFLDRAPSLAALLAQTAATAWTASSEAEQGLFEQMRQRAGWGTMPAADAEPDLPPLALLTTRETELLMCIAQGLSNQQMADRFAVSLTTVKWHLQNLYGKLNVRNRSAALARARQMDLLPH